MNEIYWWVVCKVVKMWRHVMWRDEDVRILRCEDMLRWRSEDVTKYETGKHGKIFKDKKNITGTFTHRHFYTQTLSHTFTHRFRFSLTCFERQTWYVWWEDYGIMLVVSTPLKHISHLGSLFPKKTIWKHRIRVSNHQAGTLR